MIAWAEGYLARQRFALVFECPFPFGSERAVLWCCGYRAAKREE